jgi:transposase
MIEGKLFMPIEMIEATTATQVRVKLDRSLIDRYTEDIKNGAIMPPVDVFAEQGSSRHILADGFHRVIAAVNADKSEIEVKVHEGGMHEALIFALSANRTHGQRRTNADKINAVKLALKDPKLSGLPQQEIADVCGVSINTVSRVSLRDTTDNKKAATPEDNKPENNRPTKAAPTQAEVERDELRAATKAIRAFPYEGGDAVKLALDPDDVADLEYCSAWMAHAVIACRNG